MCPLPAGAWTCHKIFWWQTVQLATLHTLAVGIIRPIHKFIFLWLPVPVFSFLSFTYLYIFCVFSTSNLTLWSTFWLWLLWSHWYCWLVLHNFCLPFIWNATVQQHEPSNCCIEALSIVSVVKYSLPGYPSGTKTRRPASGDRTARAANFRPDLEAT